MSGPDPYKNLGDALDAFMAALKEAPAARLFYRFVDALPVKGAALAASGALFLSAVMFAMGCLVPPAGALPYWILAAGFWCYSVYILARARLGRRR